jgi:hypothetical protein
MAMSIQKVERVYLGHTFVYETFVNDEGQALWNKEIDTKFSKWLHELKNQDRELFRVQYSISSNAYELLNHLKDLLGVYDDSLVVRAITLAWINEIDTAKNKAVLDRFKQYRKSPDVELLKSGKNLQKSLYFNPSGMRDVIAYSNLTEMTKSKAIKNALYSVLLISINEDKELKNYWEDVILKELMMMVKAA